MTRISFLALFLALACFTFAGCGDKTDTTKDKEKEKVADNHDHDHDHAHDEPSNQLGPNKGHIYKVEPADYMIEWVHYKGNHKNDFFILDAAGKKNVELKVDSFSVTSTVGEDEENFLLDPISADETGATAQYGLEKQELAIAMTLGIEVEFKIGDKIYKGKLPAQEPHEH